jgi:two-component system, NarL family, nitrate/nitrite response regulator NarL
VKVLVVTEIRLYRDGVAEALRRLDDVEVAATASTGVAAVLKAVGTKCDVVLLDMALADSTEAVASLLAAKPDLKVVALGVPEEGPEVVTFAEAGVCGYISRDASLSEVGDVLRCAVRGEASLSGKIAAGLLKHIAFHARMTKTGCSTQQLTPREREVVQLLQSGMTNRQIARALDLELSTVKNHVHNVLTKCGAAGRAEVRVGSAAAGD